MPRHIVKQIRRELQDSVDPHTQATFQRYFKEKVQYYGVKTKDVNALMRKYWPQVKDKSKQEIFTLCEDLLQSDYGEEAGIAFEWAYKLRRQYQPEDMTVFATWVERYVNNWAKCDTLCNHAVGELVMMYPEHLNTLRQWTKSNNRWVKRAAAVTLIIPARRGLFLQDIFSIADALLLDTDDMVQKGYGWMLKAASEAHQQEVYDYVIRHKQVMPRTALRYAIEKMPPELRAQAMAKN